MPRKESPLQYQFLPPLPGLRNFKVTPKIKNVKHLYDLGIVNFERNTQYPGVILVADAKDKYGRIDAVLDRPITRIEKRDNGGTIRSIYPIPPKFIGYVYVKNNYGKPIEEIEFTVNMRRPGQTIPLHTFEPDIWKGHLSPGEVRAIPLYKENTRFVIDRIEKYPDANFYLSFKSILLEDN